ncbi:MAG: hypothetical protein ACWGON_10670, partial [Gemmatimonadota bacterium]
MIDEQDADVGTGSSEDTQGGEQAERNPDRDTRANPFSDIQGFVEDMFENIRTFGPTVPGRHPRMELAESSDAYYFQLDLPGVKRDAIELETVG